jgi:RNA polymerase sigma-70 factor (ECF subfamily)
MASAQAGNSGDYARLLTEVESLLLRYVAHSFRKWGLGPDECQDVTQEILCAIHHKRATFDPKEPFLPWMYAIAHYKTVDHFRRSHSRKRHFEAYDQNLHDRAAEGGDSTALPDWENLASGLTDKQRTILKLVKIEGLSVSEAATRTGYSASDIKVTVHRTLKFLKSWVQKENEQ